MSELRTLLAADARLESVINGKKWLWWILANKNYFCEASGTRRKQRDFVYLSRYFEMKTLIVTLYLMNWLMDWVKAICKRTICPKTFGGFRQDIVLWLNGDHPPRNGQIQKSICRYLIKWSDKLWLDSSVTEICYLLTFNITSRLWTPLFLIQQYLQESQKLDWTTNSSDHTESTFVKYCIWRSYACVKTQLSLQ